MPLQHLQHLDRQIQASASSVPKPSSMKSAAEMRPDPPRVESDSASGRETKKREARRRADLVGHVPVDDMQSQVFLGGP
jgi:hypothetical protein